MSMFGWSYPPGCSGTPYDETGVTDLTDLVTMPEGVVCVSWDEDGHLIESYSVEIPADEYASLPAYTEGAERTVGHFDWPDDADEDEALAAAAAAYNAIKAAQ